MLIPTFLRVALALELLLASVECMFPALHFLLPIGGSVMAQTGILICLCLVFHELRDRWRGPPEAGG